MILRVQEISICVLMLVYSGFLWLYPNTFDAPLYYLMRNVEQGLWAVIATVLGLTRLLLIYSAGQEKSALVMRRSLSVATMIFLWVPLIISFWWLAGQAILYGEGFVLPGVILSIIALIMEISVTFNLCSKIARGKG